MSTSSDPIAREARFTVSGAIVAIVVALLLAAAGAALLAVARSDGSAAISVPPVSAANAAGPQIMSVSQLASLARTAAGPIYWAGAPGVGSDLEVTDGPTGNVSIRYLFGGAAAGDPRTIFTTVRTYRAAHAYRMLYADGSATGLSRLRVPGGGIAVTSAKAPNNFYVAFRHENYVALVDARSRAHALALVRSGAIRPVSPK